MTSQIHEDIERPQEAEGVRVRVRGWALGVAAAFLAASLIRPAILHPLNRVWMRISGISGSGKSSRVHGSGSGSSSPPTWAPRAA